MAKLILTDEEKAAPSCLDFDDESLGKVCKSAAMVIGEMPGDDGKEAVMTTSAAIMLVSHALNINATHSEYKLHGVTTNGQPSGDWRVTIERIDEAEEVE